MTLRIGNKDARHLWLGTNGLAETPTGPLDLMGIIRRLGFVQIDSIRNVTRAQHHILWTRNQNYRESMLGNLLKDRAIFEHFTHDASVLPVEIYPLWARQFQRMGDKAAGWYKSGLSAQDLAAIKDRIWAEGPLSTQAFDTKIIGKKEMWARPPHKKALDAMWYAGELATSHRVDFRKFYDHAERVIPDHLRGQTIDDTTAIDRLCQEALDRLSFGTLGCIQRFWEAMDAKEVRAWAETANLIPIEVQSADKSWTQSFAAPDIETRLAALSPPTTRLRIINPFDPAVRDRTRLLRLFGYEYRNEIFVPPEKRRWGYYVYPLLEGARFIGRIELKADRAEKILTVKNLWLEPKVAWTQARADKLEAELTRFGKLANRCVPHWGCARPT